MTFNLRRAPPLLAVGIGRRAYTATNLIKFPIPSSIAMSRSRHDH
jgi:hypothetical protein